ncbi:ATP-binding protein [Bradyrhizobium sp. SZCCHNR1093]|uniref:sensor histidine kinase n=1 Tax=Bradyrhizobium sp. SZCCHNR1093 TaxID=3057368 RepID=UPI0028E703DF|nr:ATP-binding protein [Bradyrhizobium sp. SZCCHNR1093]
MMRLTLAMRIGLIVIIGLLAIWIVTLARFYRARTAELEGATPPPTRLAALAELIERTPGTERGRVVDAVSSDRFEVRLVGADAAVRPPRTEPAPVRSGLRDAYARALGARPLTITSVPEPEGRWLPRLARAPQNALEFRIDLNGGDVLVVDSRSSLVLTQQGLPIGFGAGLFGTVVALFALLIMQRETRPLVRLAAAVDRVDPGGAAVPLPDVRRNAPEVRAVVTAFGRLQDRLADLMQARMALVGGIAHDVRTFATRLRLRADLIPDDAERQRAVVDISDMIRLLDDALLASRAGAGELPQELIAFDELVRAEVEDRRAHRARVRFDNAGDGRELLMLGDRVALRRIVANIIDNALKYGEAAHVSLQRQPEHAVLTVDDEGPGIPRDQRKAMLEPFTRLDTSRNRGTGGAGLGLAVVRTLVEAHRGSMEITDAPRGARIVVRLPLFLDGPGDVHSDPA